MIDPLRFYKCLSDETRLKSLLLIYSEGELCVCELVTALDEIQPKISRHLALLREDQLLLDRRQGQWIYYRVNPNLPAWVTAVLAQTLAANKALIAPHVKNLTRMGDRPQRCC